MQFNLRHLRLFAAVVERGSVSRAAEDCHVSQPAVSQAIRGLEAQLGAALFARSGQGVVATEAALCLAPRVRRGLDLIDAALAEIKPRLRLTATTAQLRAVAAMAEAENFTLAARALGLAQPTLHRTIARIEAEAGRKLFPRGTPSRAARALALAARLAFAEMAQAEADLAELAGREVGRIVVGALPLSRSFLLPGAIARFRRTRPRLPVKVVEGSYDTLIAGLRRGEIDLMIGALRDPAPVDDIVQVPLFEDRIIIVAGPHHPLAGGAPSPAELCGFPWVVAGQGTPTRLRFERFFARHGLAQPVDLVETGSMVLMRELLRITDHLAFVSHRQIESEVGLGAVVPLALDTGETRRRIGLTTRLGWHPTRAQAEFVAILRDGPAG